VKINTLLIGDGYWGKIVKPKLEELTNLIGVANSKTHIEKIIEDNPNIDFAFICTPTKTHYELCKKCIINGINIFCEKPFTGNIVKAKKLYELADLHKVSIFVDNIFLYRDEILKYSAKNSPNKFKFTWLKNEDTYKDDLINTLLYHDIYLLINFTDENWVVNGLIITDDYLKLKLYNDDKVASFNYERNKVGYKIKKIFIDDNIIDMSNPNNDPLYEIITKLNSRNLNFDTNKILTLKTLELIKKIINKK
jgi:hypothetical protein